MRPLLVSIALLLLALCRPASAGAAAAWGDAIYTADSAVTLDAAAKTAELKKILVEPSKYAALAPIMGNSLHALMLKGAKKFEALPDYYKKALVNGVRCELAVDDIDEKVAKAQYGADTLTAAQQAEERKLAKAHHDMECDGATNNNACLCTGGWALLACLAQEIAGTGPKFTCRKDAITELADKGKKALGPAIEALTKITKTPVTATPDDKLNSLTVSPSLAGVYCDAIDAAVTSSIQKLYAADALYWTVDGSAIAADVEIGKGEANLDKICANDAAKGNPVVKCLCDKKVGLLSCEGATIGAKFKAEAYLDCGATPKFDETKKDAALAAIGGGAPQPNPAPGPGAPTGAPGGNETTTAATGGAATSSLLLAPLAAAAAALLL